MAHPRCASRSRFLSPPFPVLYQHHYRQPPRRSRNSIFADDLTIWASNNQKLEASNSFQQAVRTIEEWCRKKKMILRDKSIVMFFSSGSGDAMWIPRVTMNGLTLKFDPAPKLVGVYMSRTLSFQSHVDKVVVEIQKRKSILACLSTSQWGLKKKPLRKIFLATQRSVLYYAAPAWQSWLANTQLDRLDQTQNHALRRITGQTACCPLEALRLEFGVQNYTTTSKRLVAASREKAYRLPPQHPGASLSKATPPTDSAETAGGRRAKDLKSNSPPSCRRGSPFNRSRNHLGTATTDAGVSPPP